MGTEDYKSSESIQVYACKRYMCVPKKTLQYYIYVIVDDSRFIFKLSKMLLNTGRGPHRGVGRLLLVRHQRHDPDDLRLLTGRRGQVPAGVPGVGHPALGSVRATRS